VITAPNPGGALIRFPAKAGIHPSGGETAEEWIPASAGKPDFLVVVSLHEITHRQTISRADSRR
jgi:hypothetical protein